MVSRRPSKKKKYFKEGRGDWLYQTWPKRLNKRIEVEGVYSSVVECMPSTH